MKYIYFIFIICLLSACKEDLTASWLEIDNIQLSTNPVLEGENSHSIVDAWVFINDQSMGIWELPVRMPVLEEGEYKVQIFPGIKINGISNSRAPYVFYQSHVETVNLVKKETAAISPIFTYKSIALFNAKEDFEDTGTILNPKSASDTTKISIISKADYPDIVKYGNNCAKIKLSTADTLVKLYTELDIVIPNGKIYLEMDYLTTNSFTVGILDKAGIVINDIGSFVGVNPTKPDNFVWKKIYFNITDQVHRNTNASKFDFYIFALLDAGSSEGTIYLDNIKIVHF